MAVRFTSVSVAWDKDRLRDYIALGQLICGAFVGLEIHMNQGVELINESAVAAGSKITVPIAQTCRSFVKAGKLTSKIIYLLALKCVGISIQITRLASYFPPAPPSTAN